jgi:uncharacterized protein (DUF39 family)
MGYTAIVKVENNRIVKYQDFELKSDADAHVVTYGGFTVETPATGSMDYWVIDEGAKTITHDSSTQTTEEAAGEMAYIREYRDNLLTETDWMALSDVTMSDAWKTYRQELRDIPASNTIYENVTWPDKPA